MTYERLNSDLYAPPGTDSGDVGNLKWPLGLSNNRPGLHGAGFARQQNVKDLPMATEMAGGMSSLALFIPHSYPCGSNYSIAPVGLPNNILK